MKRHSLRLSLRQGLHHSLAVSITLALAGCSLLPETAPPPEPPKPLLSNLKLTPVVVEKTRLAPGDLATLRQGYQELLETIEPGQRKVDLAHRLADIEMLLSERDQELGVKPAKPEGYYQEAIDDYLALLPSLPDNHARNEALYQLARAYELQGEPDKSLAVLSTLLSTDVKFERAGEAWFRQGELYFSREDYANAARSYQTVVEEYDDTDFLVISAYMLGWSRFKLEDYDGSLRAFNLMLDKAVTPILQKADAYNQNEILERLAPGQRRLVKDGLRLMATLFSYRGDGPAIAAFYAGEELPRYGYLLYSELAQQHLDNDRYRDSAEAYLAFAKPYSEHPHAVSFFVKHIDAYLLGNFPSLVYQAKQGFVETFGLNGNQWRWWSGSERERAIPYLHQYLQELAQTEHSLAQQLDGQAQGALKTQAFANAARWYREFLATFPRDPLAPQMAFDLGESLFEAGQFNEAIEAYEDFAYRYPEHEKAADGAYGALVAYERIISDVSDKSTLRARRDSRARFVETFASDSRAPGVAQILMQQGFSAEDYLEAIHWSNWLLARSVEASEGLNAEMQASARRVKAHSQFALKDFVSAEQGYRTILANDPLSDAERGEFAESLALSIYRQAQQAVEEKNLIAAIDLFSKVISDAPQSKVRLNAQYDAATYLLQTGQWQQAESLLTDFRSRFAEHKLSADLPDKLIYLYEQTQDWAKAAQILLQTWQAQPASHAGQEALWLAAEYFEKAGDRNNALLAYRDYANSYSQPFAQVTEARFILSEYYLQSGEEDKRRFWLNKLMEGHNRAGSDAGERSLTLAAMAASVFADDAAQAFTDIRLKLPLKQSLQRKRAALDKALVAYQQVMDYGVREYTTAANHHLGELYLQLAKDLMASERPKNLSEFELEQYDILLEEQAYPFEEQAIALYETNAKRSWQGVYDDWVKQSFQQLSTLLPGRYGKVEQQEELSRAQY
ncbi:tetratricopeptide repeat protein [Aliiglaciecola sp. CAU 1673]|uniref:tetratricopeptide repeat protein n=1 Tax=Aliiglaciecola sp. CAU 1673 TaxID=3032595 RepID=UPI0023DB57E5|nr:tetratricopeptide repeat protein [Aliiglaciecola sp. CAU 1673]MDF2177856.1 tetratricopeptide repeat protein [Aliiglaciecola sp. CAU 1673]